MRNFVVGCDDQIDEVVYGVVMFPVSIAVDLYTLLEVMWSKIIY